MKEASIAIVVFFFFCAGITAQTAAIKAPAATDVWMIGDKQNIAWDYTGSAKVRLILFNANNAKVGVIQSGLQLSDGVFAWTVGDLEGGAPVPPTAKGYRIRLRLDGSTDTLSTSAEFEIASAVIVPPAPLPPPPPPGGDPPGGDPPGGKKIFPRDRLRPPDPGQIMPMLRVNKPVDGDKFFPGDTCAIEWSLPGGAYSNVKIRFYPSGYGSLYAEQQAVSITHSTPNTGSFDWKLGPGERTGKFVVQVLTSDNKVHGESGVFTIAAKAPPPGGGGRGIARDVDTLLAKSASISVKGVDLYYPKCGLETMIVKMQVDAVPADGQTDFILSPDVGHPQFGSLFLRCRLENPLASSSGAISANAGFDRWVSLKGGGGSLKMRKVHPTAIPGGDNRFDIVFDLAPPVPLHGVLVALKMPRDLLGAGNVCKLYYFPKLIVTVYLLTRSGEAVATRMRYVIYDERDCDLFSVTPPGEVTNCQEGVQDW